MIRMIVTDLDGTLLRKDKTISEYTASIFQCCSNNGIKIVFATARPIRAVKMLGLNLHSDASVYHNGAVITIGDELFQETGIGYESAKVLLHSAVRMKGMKVAAEIDDVLYANFDTSTVWPGVHAVRTDFAHLPEKSVDKIIFITADRCEISEIEKLLDEDLYWEISENEVLMVMNKNARKKNATSALASHFGISLSEIAAFGDDYNDIEMIRDCGSGVAVANAIDEVKAVADYICQSNDEDGVAKWIEEFCMNSLATDLCQAFSV